MHRRLFLTAAASTLAMSSAARALTVGNDYPVSYSEAEWKERLGPDAYRVMREAGTERAFTSPLNEVKAAGTFHCRGCDQALYPSDTKFESGTGWPSFWAPVSAEAVGTQPDRSLFRTRTEVHCSNCGSHMGHIFDDGPEPTGKRHCINGIAMVFRPQGGGDVIVG